jgi:hypothetical protein
MIFLRENTTITAATLLCRLLDLSLFDFPPASIRAAYRRRPSTLHTLSLAISSTATHYSATIRG